MRRSNRPTLRDSRTASYSNEPLPALQSARPARPSLRSQPRLSSSLRHASTPFASSPPASSTDTLTQNVRVNAVPDVDRSLLPKAAGPAPFGQDDRLKHTALADHVHYPPPDTSATPSALGHQPFIDLSPTPSPTTFSPSVNILEKMQSTASTPHSTIPFDSAATPDHRHMEHGRNLSADEQHALPSLYDMVLKMNMDPRLTPWWDNVTKVLRDAFHAERAVLAIPIDATDIENVPWVLRASLDVSGLEHRPSKVGSDSKTQADSTRPNQSNPWRSLSTKNLSGSRRPALSARHSFAGYEATRIESSPITQRLPSDGSTQNAVQKPLRKAHFSDEVTKCTKDHVSDTGVDDSAKIFSRTLPASLGKDYDAQSTVFAPLRTLQSEVEPIVEPSHIMRVLDTNKTLVITRTYSINRPNIECDNGETLEDREVLSSQNTRTRAMKAKVGHSNNLQMGTKRFRKDVQYEEVEQLPPSPWSHSPAPSPAVQADPDENPFFTSANVEEESFAPLNEDRDYSKTGPVEAIGIDRASTIIHLPLFHPLFRNSTSILDAQPGQKAPVAILSILSNIVPYSQDLLNMLKYLGPHLANSYQTSCQLLHHDAIASVPPAVSRFNHYGDRQASTQSNGLASPSRSSIYSKHSSTGSNVGSPAASSIGVAGASPEEIRSLPSSHETFSYFDRRTEDSSVTTVSKVDEIATSTLNAPVADRQKINTTVGKAELDAITILSAAGVEKPLEAIDRALQYASGDLEKYPDNTGVHYKHSRSKDKPRTAAKSKPGKKYTVLHSNGADFGATFQTLPSTALPRHSRSSSSEDHIVAPPSEKLLRLIIDAAPIHMVITEPGTGKLSWFNTKYLVYCGHPKEQILRDPYGWIAPDDRQSYIDAWTACLASGHQFQRKVRLKRYDGKYLWFFVRAVPLRDVNQNIVHWLGTGIDINDHHLAEIETRRQSLIAEANAKYRALADSCPQITFTATRNSGITLCNNQWLLYSGQSEEEAHGIGFIEHVHPDDLKKCRLPAGNGSDGRQSEVPVSVGMKARRKLNRTASAKSGSRSETSGDEEPRPITESSGMPQIKLSELADTGILQVKRNEVGRIEYDTEVRLKNREGSFRWHMVKVVLTDSNASTRPGEQTWFGSCSDINDHKELAIQLKNAMEAKSRFVSNMSHEMRTPLNGISGNISLMSATPLTDEQAEFLNAVRSSAEGLQQLVNDVLDFSKAEAGMMNLQMEAFRVRSMVEDVNDTTAVKAIEKGLELNFIVDDKVPATIKGDKGRLRQVLWNIVSNAIKFTSKGEILVQCETVKEEHGPPSPKTFEPSKEPHNSAAEESIMIQFTVSDTGAGFTQKDKIKLFQRFSQIDGSSTRQHGGTGLGLVISKALVELHGGSMSAEGEFGRGAQFMFSIKVGIASSGDDSSLKPNIWHDQHSFRNMRPQSSSAQEANTSAVIFGGRLHDPPRPQDTLQHVNTDVSLTALDGSESLDSISSAASTLNARPFSEASKANDSVRTSHAFKQSASIVTKAEVSQMLCNILVSCPLEWALKAAVHHVKSVAPIGVPVSVSSERSFERARKLLLDEKLIFSHIVFSSQQTSALIEVVQTIFSSPHLAQASVIVIGNFEQKRSVIQSLQELGFEHLIRSRRLAIVLKPLKPSKLAPFFDPNKSREMSTDHNQHTALQTVNKERKLYDRVREEFAGRDIRVLVVEDNSTNVNVIKGFFRRVKIAAEVAHDGVECTELVFKNNPSYYSLILCDLQMPNKDGLQACREIRDWEKRGKSVSRLPIVALSANVLGEVSDDCKRAGFDHYLQKPIDYGELSKVMTTLIE